MTTIDLVHRLLPMASMIKALGMVASSQGYCPFEGREEMKRKQWVEKPHTGTAFCVYHHQTKGHEIFYCHGCHRTGDVIDLYKLRAGKLENKVLARRLLEMVEEGVFNLDLQVDRTVRGQDRRIHGEPDEDWRALKEVQVDLPRVEAFKEVDVTKLERVKPAKAKKIWRLIHEGYPDDSMNPVSDRKRGGYIYRSKAQWLRSNGVLERQSFCWPACFVPGATHAYKELVLARDWLIVEADKVPKPKQLAILFYLARKYPRIPLHLIVDSLGRSYQGWFFIEDVSKARWLEMFREAVSLGADKAMYQAWRKCRMPNGWCKERGGKQKIVWLSQEFRNKSYNRSNGTKRTDRRKHKATRKVDNT